MVIVYRCNNDPTEAMTRQATKGKSMKTTKTVSSPKSCGKCSGYGYISSFQHVKGGECFQCQGTGKHGLNTKEIEMSDEEVLAKLESIGFTLELPEALKTPEGADWLLHMFENKCPRIAALEVARNLLAAA